MQVVAVLYALPPPPPLPRFPAYILLMATPQTLVVRTFTDRAEGLSHFVLRAGEAPRLLAFDDALGCPVETALAALEWTGAVGHSPR